MIVLLVVGLVLYAIGLIPGLPQWVKPVVGVVIVIIVLLWFLEHFAGGRLGL